MKNALGAVIVLGAFYAACAGFYTLVYWLGH